METECRVCQIHMICIVATVLSSLDYVDMVWMVLHINHEFSHNHQCHQQATACIIYNILEIGITLCHLDLRIEINAMFSIIVILLL